MFIWCSIRKFNLKNYIWNYIKYNIYKMYDNLNDNYENVYFKIFIFMIAIIFKKYVYYILKYIFQKFILTL